MARFRKVIVAKKIMKMYRGKTNPEKWTGREGLMFPEWLLSRIGGSRLKLMVELKKGKVSIGNKLQS